MNNIELKNYVEANPKLIKVKSSIRYPELKVLKYTKRCFFKNIWNKYTMMCRGLVVDENYNIVTKPFNKIFNYGIESRAPRISGESIVTAYRKINGFMCAVSLYNNEMLISTTGSLDSEYCDMARDMILSNIDIDWLDIMLQPNTTLLFEIVHPNDPHIIPEVYGVYFIGMNYSYNEYKRYIKNLKFLKHYDIDMYGVIFPELIVDKFSNIKKLVKTVKHEGFVIYDENNNCVKLKSPYYLMKKLLARSKNVEDLLKSNIKNKVDEEYWGLIDHIKNDVENFSLQNEQERLNYIRTYFEEANFV